MATVLKPGTASLLGKARAALARAVALIERGAAERAADRAYASMLHTAKALLNESGLRLHAHRKILDACARRCAAGAPSTLPFTTSCSSGGRSGNSAPRTTRSSSATPSGWRNWRARSCAGPKSTSEPVRRLVAAA